MNKKSLSLVLAHRNDNYMGNSNWRLEVTLNFIANQLYAIQEQHQTEIIVVDWASSQPLHEAIVLNDAAKHIVRFIEVPISVHEKVNQGSSFPVAIALNAGIRRAAGDFIALTSGDVLWTSNTLKSFILPVTTGIKYNDALDQTLIFIPRKNIPWKFVNQSPGMEEMTNYITDEGDSLDVEPLLPFYLGCAGALVMHRNLWSECRGNDERLVFWGYNDIDLCLRVRLKYSCIDYFESTRHSVYHLEHYPSRQDKDIQPRKSNPHLFNPFVVNGPAWGLAQYTLAEFPKPRDGSISLLPAVESRREHLYRLHHLNNILCFMITKFSIKHFRWTYSIFKDFIVDTFTPYRKS